MQQAVHHARTRPIGPGGFDWLDVWRRMYDAERAQAEAVTPPGFSVTNDCWQQQSQRFAAAVRRVEQPDPFMSFVLPHLRPTDIVLDIGAGAGRYEPVLARAVAQVIAIEPSASMRAHLEQRIAEEALERVQVVPEPWPEADVPACDVAIAAHVLYGVREVGPFLQRMDAVARRACFLVLGIQHPSSFISPFWEQLHGEPRLPLPGAIECLNVLYQLGIPAHLSHIRSTHRFRYIDDQEALADIRWRLRLLPDPVTDAAIVEAIGHFLEREDDGRLIPRNHAGDVAVIWWSCAAVEEVVV